MMVSVRPVPARSGCRRSPWGAGTAPACRARRSWARRRPGRARRRPEPVARGEDVVDLVAEMMDAAGGVALQEARRSASSRRAAPAARSWCWAARRRPPSRRAPAGAAARRPSRRACRGRARRPPRDRHGDGDMVEAADHRPVVRRVLRATTRTVADSASCPRLACDARAHGAPDRLATTSSSRRCARGRISTARARRRRRSSMNGRPPRPRRQADERRRRARRPVSRAVEHDATRRHHRRRPACGARRPPDPSRPHQRAILGMRPDGDLVDHLGRRPARAAPCRRCAPCTTSGTPSSRAKSACAEMQRLAMHRHRDLRPHQP